MDQLNRYRQIVRRVLEEFVDWAYHSDKKLRREIVFDPVLDHFELIECGWLDHRRIHTVIFHIDIIDGKVWVQHDATNRPIVDDLLRAGIPKSDIVLGFHPADIRPHTEFAVG